MTTKERFQIIKNRLLYESNLFKEDLELIEKDLNRLERLENLESIEKELGCPLEFAIIPFRLSDLKKIWYHNQWCDVVRIVCYEEGTRPYLEIRCKDYKYLKMLFLDNYQKTWWIKEDEVLENE